MTTLDRPDPNIVELEKHQSGARATVWKARQVNPSRAVAVKMLHPSLEGVESILEHANGMARAGDHPNVATIYQVTTIAHPETQTLVDAIVMEWLEGETLTERLQGPLFELMDAKSLCNQLLDGLDHIHSKGVVHNDLHPGNVILCNGTAKILDIDYCEDTSLALLTTRSREHKIVADVQQLSSLLWGTLQKTALPFEVTLQFKHATTRARTVREVREALLAMFSIVNVPSELLRPSVQGSLPLHSALQAVSESRADARLHVERWFDDVIRRLDESQPVRQEGSEWDDVFMDALAASIPLACEFARLSQAVSSMGDAKAALTLSRCFGRLISRYGMRGIGSYRETDFDLYRFLGHECFTILVGHLLHFDEWELVRQMWRRPIYVEEGVRPNDPADFLQINEYIQTLENRNRRLRLGRPSLRADLLSERHGTGELASLSPFSNILAADLFLALANVSWRPWTIVCLKNAPRFLVESVSKEFAEQVCLALGFTGPDELKERISATTMRAMANDHLRSLPCGEFSTKLIATR